MGSAIFLFSMTQFKEDIRYKFGAIPQKNPNRDVEDMEFPGVLNEQNVEIPGVNTKRSGIYWGNPEEIMWNFHGSWLMALGIPMDVTQFCGIFRDKLHFVWNFQG